MFSYVGVLYRHGVFDYCTFETAGGKLLKCLFHQQNTHLIGEYTYLFLREQLLEQSLEGPLQTFQFTDHIYLALLFDASRRSLTSILTIHFVYIELV